MASKKAAKKSAARKKKAAPARKPAIRKAAPKLTRDGGPVGWPSLSPYMTVADANASVEFYARAFGFKVEGTLMKDDHGRVTHAGMSLGESKIMFAPQGMDQAMMAPTTGAYGIGLSLYVYVPNVDKHAARAVAAGAQMLQAPADQFWRDRIAIFKDPDGYHWTFATHLG